jgi:hypothetical protein
VRINDTARGFVSAGLFKRWKRLHPTHIAAPARHVVGAFCRCWYGRFSRVQGCIVGDSGRLRVSGTDHRWRDNIRRRHGRVMHESSTLSSLLMGSKQWDAQGSRYHSQRRWCFERSLGGGQSGVHSRVFLYTSFLQSPMPWTHPLSTF